MGWQGQGGGESDSPSLSPPPPCDLMTCLGLFQLYGYCYQDSEDIPDTLTTITELGAPVEMIQLLQTSWEDRFRVSREAGQGPGLLAGMVLP